MDKYGKTALRPIAEFMKEAITERGLSLRELSRQSTVSRTIINKILAGENYEITSLIKVLRVLNIHLQFQLMSEDNNVMTI